MPGKHFFDQGIVGEKMADMPGDLGYPSESDRSGFGERKGSYGRKKF